MGCRDVHAATVLSFLCGIASVAGLFAGTLLPNWRKLRLITFNRNEKNLTVYTGLWVKCARYDGGNDCLMYDTTWYSSVDQLDLRVLQFALPLSILIAMGALLLCLIGMCNTAFRSSVPNIKLAKCLVNSAGCHLVAGLLFSLAGTVSLSPSIWVIFYNIHLNKKFEPVFTFDYAVNACKEQLCALEGKRPPSSPDGGQDPKKRGQQYQSCITNIPRSGWNVRGTKILRIMLGSRAPKRLPRKGLGLGQVTVPERVHRSNLALGPHRGTTGRGLVEPRHENNHGPKYEDSDLGKIRNAISNEGNSITCSMESFVATLTKPFYSNQYWRTDNTKDIKTQNQSLERVHSSDCYLL
ncbi:Claudin-12 isoform 2-like protein [Camelus ferus]|nr:Claudin-12 isoform 2-like protein [Camelus ferus]